MSKIYFCCNSYDNYNPPNHWVEGVESNPGPAANKPNLKVRIYNCNGLGDLNKMRWVFNKSQKDIDNGGIVLLQETHVKDEKIINKSQWYTWTRQQCQLPI